MLSNTTLSNVPAAVAAKDLQTLMSLWLRKMAFERDLKIYEDFQDPSDFRSYAQDLLELRAVEPSIDLGMAFGMAFELGAIVAASIIGSPFEPTAAIAVALDAAKYEIDYCRRHPEDAVWTAPDMTRESKVPVAE